jgi:hypothetical protein
MLEMTKDQYGSVNGPENLAPRSLREACQRIGLDEDGARCPDCLLKDLCESQMRWLVPLAPTQRHRF